MPDQSQITVEEGNRLIAEFLGGKVYEAYRHGDYVDYAIEGKWVKDFRDSENNMKTGGMGFKMMLANCKFHSRPDWLMPVVEKIEQGNYGFKMCRKVVEVYFDDTKEIILKTKEKCRRESLWLAVVKFIQWYNSHKSKQ